MYICECADCMHTCCKKANFSNFKLDTLLPLQSYHGEELLVCFYARTKNKPRYLCSKRQSSSSNSSTQAHNTVGEETPQQKHKHTTLSEGFLYPFTLLDTLHPPHHAIVFLCKGKCIQG